MTLTEYERREMVRMAAEILDSELGGRAMPMGEERVQSSKGGGKAFLDWAIDMKSCGVEAFAVYLAKDQEGPMTPKQKGTVRKFWDAVRKKRGLIPTGLWIMEQNGYESLNIAGGA